MCNLLCIRLLLTLVFSDLQGMRQDEWQQHGAGPLRPTELARELHLHVIAARAEQQ